MKIEVPSTYSEARAKQDALYQSHRNAGRALQAFPKTAMNLTTDAAKASPEWKTAKATYDRSFDELKAFNTVFTKRFKKEIRSNHCA